MDLGDVFSSNTKTTFVAGTSTSDYIKLDLEDVVRFATTCVECQLNGNVCDYVDITNPCSYCAEHDLQCVSLMILQFLSDKAPVQVSMARKWDAIIQQNFENADVFSRVKHTYAF